VKTLKRTSAYARQASPDGHMQKSRPVMAMVPATIEQRKLCGWRGHLTTSWRRRVHSLSDSDAIVDTPP
jgi:hypothetical protein